MWENPAFSGNAVPFRAEYSCSAVVSAPSPAGGKPTASNPVVIVLQAAIDNKEEPEDLPLSPWN